MKAEATGAATTANQTEQEQNEIVRDLEQRERDIRERWQSGKPFEEEGSAMKLEGVHHVTAITGDAPNNVEFYAGVLGLRVVKKTVNQDDPTVYHLFYADEKGSAGSDITFFEYPGASRGRAGAGMVHLIAWRVASGGRSASAVVSETTRPIVLALHFVLVTRTVPVEATVVGGVSNPEPHPAVARQPRQGGPAVAAHRLGGRVGAGGRIGGRHRPGSRLGVRRCRAQLADAAAE